MSTSHRKGQGCRGSQFMSRLGGSPEGPPYLSGPALALGPVPQLSTIKDSRCPLCLPTAPPASPTTSDKNSCSPKPTAYPQTYLHTRSKTDRHTNISIHTLSQTFTELSNTYFHAQKKLCDTNAHKCVHIHRHKMFHYLNACTESHI